MTPADLETVIARTGHERFRDLTSDANPDAAQREAYRGLVARMAAEQPPAYPSLLTQAGNAAKAVVRFVASGGETVDRSEFDRRRSICEACPNMDKAQSRCRLCGCSLAVKPWSKAERCPDDPPRW